MLQIKSHRLEATRPVSTNLSSFDLAKFICALLIIVIHTSPLEKAPQTCDFYLSHVIARIAVPLFYAMSGYLLFRKMPVIGMRIQNTSENRKSLLRQLKRIALLYVLWTVAYFVSWLPRWYQMDWWGLTLLKDQIKAFFLTGSHYHLWYLLSLLYALPILYLLSCLCRPKHLITICSFAWIIGLLSYSYRFLGYDRLPLLPFLSDTLSVPFESVTRALPLLAIGAFCARKDKHLASPILVLLSFALCVAEASVLRFCTPNDGSYSYLLSTPLFAYSALSFLLTRTWTLPNSLCSLFRSTSLTIYCLHPLIIETLDLVNFPKGFFHFGAVSTITIFLAVAWYYVRKSVKKKCS